MNMQVTDVNKRSCLLRGSAMRATPSFSSLRGGVIRNNETKFRGRNNVCRMTVKFCEEGFCEAGLSRDGGWESEVLRKPVRRREYFEEIACAEMESEEAKPPEILRDPGAPTPRISRSTASYTYLADLDPHCVAGKTQPHKKSENQSEKQIPEILFDYGFLGGLCKSREMGGRNCCSRVWYQEKGWYMSMGLQRWSATSRGWASRRSS